MNQLGGYISTKPLTQTKSNEFKRKTGNNFRLPYVEWGGVQIYFHGIMREA